MAKILPLVNQNALKCTFLGLYNYNWTPANGGSGPGLLYDPHLMPLNLVYCYLIIIIIIFSLNFKFPGGY